MRLLVVAGLVACSSAPSAPPQPQAQPVAAQAPAPQPAPAAAPAPAPTPEATKPATPPAAAPSEGAEVVRAYLQKKYPELMAANAHVGAIESPALAEVKPGTEAYGFGVGALYPIATIGPHARHVLFVDEKKHEVVLDFDSTVKDPEAAAALREALPAATPATVEKVAQAAATLLPLDPFFKNPELSFKVKKGPGRRTTALAQATSYKYEIAFGPDGKIQSVTRQDNRPKPICYQHRAQAQALLDREHPGLRAGDVIWDDLSAERIPDHYVYEVRTPDGARAGLVAVKKGPGAAWFVATADRAGLDALSQTVVSGHDRAATQVKLQLLYHAGAIAHAPLGVPYLP